MIRQNSKPVFKKRVCCFALSCIVTVSPGFTWREAILAIRPFTKIARWLQAAALLRALTRNPFDRPHYQDAIRVTAAAVRRCCRAGALRAQSNGGTDVQAGHRAV